MQVTFINSATGSVTNISAGSHTLTITKPTGVLDGDLLIAHFAGASNLDTIATLTGWTLLDSDATAGQAASFVFWKIAASEGASYAWTYTAGGGATSGSGAINAFRNTHQTSPFDQQTKKINSPASGTATGTTITPTTSPQSQLLALMSAGSGTSVTFSSYAVVTSNPTWTQAFAGGSNQGAGEVTSIGGAYAGRDFLTATGAFTSGMSGSQTSTVYFMSLRPAGLSVTDGLSATAAESGTISAAATPATLVTFGVVDAAPTPTIATGLPKWSNASKDAASWTDAAKHAASFTDAAKSASNWSNQSKS